jgi:hypothetical protein
VGSGRRVLPVWCVPPGMGPGRDDVNGVRRCYIKDPKNDRKSGEGGRRFSTRRARRGSPDPAARPDRRSPIPPLDAYDAPHGTLLLPLRCSARSCDGRGGRARRASRGGRPAVGPSGGVGRPAPSAAERGARRRCPRLARILNDTDLGICGAVRREWRVEAAGPPCVSRRTGAGRPFTLTAMSAAHTLPTAGLPDAPPTPPLVLPASSEPAVCHDKSQKRSAQALSGIIRHARRSRRSMPDDAPA